MKKLIVFFLMGVLFELNGLSSIDEEEAKFLKMLNDYRVRMRRQPVKLCASIEKASEYYANFMAEMDTCRGHECDGKSSTFRCRKAGYEAWCAECVAWGPNPWGASAEYAFMQWRTSPGHNSIMLDSGMQAVGIARAVSKSKLWFWVLNTGTIWNKSCEGINPQCKTDSDCANNPQNKVCKEGICVECKYDYDCPNNMKCIQNQCITPPPPKPGECRRDEDCVSKGKGWRCVNKS
jgi:hypothetical protein